MRHLRIALCATMLLLSPGVSVKAETVVPIDLDGATVNFVVPDGYCVLDRSDPEHAALIERYYPLSETAPLAILIFLKCSLLASDGRDAFDVENIAIDIGYYSFNKGWTDYLKQFESANRKGYIEVMNRFFLDSMDSILGKRLKEKFESQNDRMTSAMLVYPTDLTGYDRIAAYTVLRVQTHHSGTKSLFGYAEADSMLYRKSVQATILRRIEDVDGLEVLREDVASLMGATIAANPDSDN